MNRVATWSGPIGFFFGMRPTRAALARRRGLTPPPSAVPPAEMPLGRTWRDYYLFLVLSWRLGIISFTRWQYWRQLLGMVKRNPSRLMGYLASCARGEQMFYLRDVLRQRLTETQSQ